jgi:hypothetical protein
MATKKKRRPARRKATKKKATRRPAARKKVVRRKKATVRKKATKKRVTKKRVVRRKATRRRNPVASKKKATKASSSRTRTAKKTKVKARRSYGAAKRPHGGSSARSEAALKRSYSVRSKKRAAAWDKYRSVAKRAGRPAKRKSSVTLKAGYPMSKKRRKHYISQGKLSSRGMANPPKRRRKNPRRKNPSLMSCFQQLGKTSFWIGGGQTVAGISAVVILPSVLEQVAAKLGAGAYVRNSGGTGVALAAVSTAIAMCGAQAVENMAIKRGILPKAFNGLAARVAAGGMVVTVLKALEVFARGVHDKLNLPSVPTPFIRVPGISAMPMPQGGGAVGDWVQLRGMGDFMELKGMGLGGGMGNVEMPNALVAGESFARSISQFDGYGMGDYRIPVGSIRGMGDSYPSYPGQYGAGTGFGDYLPTNGGSAISMQPNANWEPSPLETF